MLGAVLQEAAYLSKVSLSIRRRRSVLIVRHCGWDAGLLLLRSLQARAFEHSSPS